MFMGRFGMFDVHFLLLFVGAGSARDCRLHDQRMETAKGRRQSHMTDNRTLILLSISTYSYECIHNSLFSNTLFVIFTAFRTSFFF
ncbi:Secreted protein [Pseudomonas jessenii]